MAMDALPTPPSTASPSTFETLMDALLAALPGFVTGANALETNVVAKESAATASATAAAASAVSAGAAVGAAVWASGSYNVGAVAYSPINFQSYRAKTTGSKPTDPANDATNWTCLTAPGAALLSGADFTGEVKVPAGIDVKALGGDDGGQIYLLKPPTNSTISGDLIVGIYQNYFVVRESGGSTRGAKFDLTQCAGAAASIFAMTSDKGSLRNLTSLNANSTLNSSQLGGGILYSGSTAAQTLTLPTIATVESGKGYWLINHATVSVTIDGNGAEVITRMAAGVGFLQTASMVLEPGDSVFIFSDGATWNTYGMLFANSPMLGVGQTWQDVSGSRAAVTTYTNTTGKPIEVMLSTLSAHLSTTLTYTVSGITCRWSSSGSVTGIDDAVTFIVPPGGTYASSHTHKWLELR